jgi:hypothetical protein
MKKIVNYLLVVSFVGILIACTKDFIVKDIKNDTVSIIAPADNLNTPNNAVTFWWDELDGAEKYNLQIVKPSFSAVIQLIVDTNITLNKFKKVLTPGTYQWRIKAINGAGSTAYTTRTLVIDTTSNLSFITLNPIAPVGLLTGNKVVTFSWTPHPSADHYEINVLNSGGTSIHTQNNITAANYTYTFTIPGDLIGYKWQVKAHNSFSFSQYNSASTFSIDITAPSVSQLNSPVNGAIKIDTSSFMWTRISSDTKYDSIIVSNDSLGNSLIGSRRVNGLNYKINLFSLPSPGPSSGYYWWRIISVDSVKNKSAMSLPQKFTLTP